MRSTVYISIRRNSKSRVRGKITSKLGSACVCESVSDSESQLYAKEKTEIDINTFHCESKVHLSNNNDVYVLYSVAHICIMYISYDANKLVIIFVY